MHQSQFVPDKIIAFLPVLSLLLFSLSGAAFAEHDVYSSSTRYRFEQISPLSIEAPSPPATRIGPGPEGWVKLRFSINADGTTANIDVLDFMPSTFSRINTIKAVESWIFQPAVLEGKAIDWHNNIVVVNFDLPEIPNISGPQFTTAYSEVQNLISEGRLDRAARQASDNLKSSTFSLHDIGLGNMQLATLQMQRQDIPLAHQAITRATLPEINQLTNGELEIALLYRFNIELSLGRYMDALDSYERRTRIVATQNTDEAIHQQAEQIQMALDQGFTLNAKGKILDRDAGWFFIPSRRAFTITDTDGKLDSIEVVCNQRRVSLEYQADIEWSLPQSWGECSLTVMGDRNTTFTFYEFTD